jgi:hypothetical protein
MLKKRIAEISIMNLDKIPHDRAAFGSTVNLREDNGESITYQLVMPEEADAARVSSRPARRSAARLSEDRGRRDHGHDSQRHAQLRDHQARHDPRRGVSYSPQLRTAVLLTGNGTGGAYHAGVLRALHEAGVKIDVMSGRGVGIVCALFGAIDAGAKTWEDGGVWRRRPAIRMYEWRGALRWAAAIAIAGVAVLAFPLLVLATGLVAYPLGFLVQMINVDLGLRLASAYTEMVGTPFRPMRSRRWCQDWSCCALRALSRCSRWRHTGFGRSRRRSPVDATAGLAAIEIGADGGRGSSARRGAPSRDSATSARRCGNCFKAL